MPELAYLIVLEKELSRIASKNLRLKEYVLLAWEYFKIDEFNRSANVIGLVVENPDYLDGQFLKDLEYSQELRTAFAGLVQNYGIDLMVSKPSIVA